MNDIKLTSLAEQKAEASENLKAFSGLKLLHVKRELAKILAQIGKEGIFDEYTKHDISHIDYMLDSLDWIIPDRTKELLTPSDWLMIVLSIYFHDLGMLVTKEEFTKRNISHFPAFKKEILDGKMGLDYRDKILGLSTDRIDRFIYQELVRKTHAERIKYWILEENSPMYPQDLPIANEIKKLIERINPMFKRDLALICESHHLTDLDNFDKYKTNHPYGTTPKEVVNLQYAALILRTSDLLHITSDRTPSVEFNLINPTDPISQEEWAKQRAVTSIRPKIMQNKEGALDPSLPTDTLEIIALFKDEKGFFGLISFLNYANKELIKNFQYNEIAKKQHASKFEYPWKHLDDSSIETIDFEKRQFEFTLDQTRILDLLVGHTLYNDPTVVLRELTQNAIDASKLKKYDLQIASDNSYVPEIKVDWNSTQRTLSFIDNGTGMTLEIIQNHLLKVGSSRYQDEQFKKKYPDFSPISRFGIGLLTCFLIADDLDILTRSSDSEKAILLKIKKIHGKYLLKYLSIEKIDPIIKNHGTSIKLYVRADVDLKNIRLDLKKWVLFPNCKLRLVVDGSEESIGYSSPSEVITYYLEEIGYKVDGISIKVEQQTKNGVTIAFALRYVEYFKEWVFIEYREVGSEKIAPVGICIEGIRVDFNTPGFNGKSLLAVANTTGKGAPKTNVARSNIEITPEREYLLVTIYQLFLQHISTEVQNLRKSFSISWAAYEANWLINSVVKSERSSSSSKQVVLEDRKSFNKALFEMNCVLFEKDAKREILSINDLIHAGHYWTIDCASYTSADSLIKEVKASDVSALSLLRTILGADDSNTEHIDNLLCNSNSNNVVDGIIGNLFKVVAIKMFPEQRRLDLKWAYTTDKIWEELDIEDNEYSFRPKAKCYVQLKDIEIDQSIEQIAINSADALFILKNSELNRYLVRLTEKLNNDSYENRFVLSKIVGLINDLFHYKDLDKSKIEDILEYRFERSPQNISRIIWSKVDKEEFVSIILKTKFYRYDTTVWYRRAVD